MVHKIKVYDRYSGEVLFIAEVKEEPSTRSEELRLAVLWALENGISLHRANLTGANLSETNLSCTNLSCTDLSCANLFEADLSGTDLSCAVLYNTNLHKANLPGADLSGTDLYNTNFYKANLSGADFFGADIYKTNFSGAVLSKADLSGASLTKVNFSIKETEFSKILGINTPIARTRILPEGSIIGWKRCRDGVLVKLRIPEEAKRSHAFGRKCRAEFADVLEVIGAEEARSYWDPSIVYKVGERVYPDSFDENWTEECAPGIHFFITREEAEAYL